MALTRIGRGTRARSDQVNQIIDLLNGDATEPVTLLGAVTLSDDFTVTDGADTLFAVTAAGTQVGNAVLDGTGAVGLRFRGTADVSAGTWQATNGSPSVTRAEASDSGVVRRWQAVKIGATTYRAAEVGNAAGTTTITLDGNYGGATGAVEVFVDDSEAFDLKDGDGNILLSVRTNGDVLFGTNANLPATHLSGNSDDNAKVSDFWYDAVHRRVHLRSIIMAEANDPPELAFRRIEGTYPDGPFNAAVGSGATLGLIYWQGSTAAGDANHRAALIYAKATQTFAATVGGELVFATTQNGGTSPTDRWSIGNGGGLYFKNAADTAWLLGAAGDSSDNFLLAYDGGINDVKTANVWNWYQSVGGSIGATLNPTNGLLLPSAPATPVAGYLTRESGAKFWAVVTEAAGVYTLQTSFNVTGIAKNGTGDVSVTINTDFTSSNFVAVATTNQGVDRFCSVTTPAAGSVRVFVFDASSGGVAAESGFTIIGFGIQV